MAELTPEERQRIYEEEKARLEAQSRPSSQPQRGKRPNIGCGTTILVLFGLFAFAVLFHITDGRRRQAPQSPVSPTPKTRHEFIDYTVLRQWIPGKSGVGMDVLVSPTAKRIDVMQLANYMASQLKSQGRVVIFIFDSQEAWANRDNSRYPEKEYFKHFLVAVMIPPLKGESAVRWMAEGREEPPPKK